MNQTVRTVVMWIVILVAALLIMQIVLGSTGGAQEISFSDFLNDVENDRVDEVLIKQSEIRIHSKGAEVSTGIGGRRYDKYTYDPGYRETIGILLANKVGIEVEEPSDGKLLTALLYWAPLLILLALWFVFFRQMQAGGTKAMSFGKSKAKLLTPDQKRVTFADVAGVNEAKEELEEIIDFLKDPKKFQRLGGKIPKGVLLMGSPGTGKTLLAKAVAGEAEVPFFSISGSDFVEMFVGVGASRVRDLFEQGKKNAPCIIFIDEIDAVGRHRGAGLGGGHDEREQTLNQLLVEMDGFESNEGVILISATNRPDVLDPALLRPGRFDRRIVVSGPDVKGREGILKVHSTKIPLSADVDLAVVARATPGFSGADLASLVNEAALRAARLNKMKVDMADFEFAKDKVMMGSERRSLVMSEEEKRNTAYHEAGHALVAAIVPEADPLHKVTIIPRGRALGLTQQLPLEDRYTHTRSYLEANLKVLMGGRIAEEIAFGSDYMTTGAGSDIERATELARKMVCEWGMSPQMGPLTFGKREEAIFLGKEFARHQDYSDSTAVDIDRELKRFITEAYQGAREILEEHRDALEFITTALLEREVLDGDEIYDLIKEHSGVEILPSKRKAPPPGSSAAAASETADQTASQAAEVDDRSESEPDPEIPAEPPGEDEQGLASEGSAADETESREDTERA